MFKLLPSYVEVSEGDANGLQIVGNSGTYVSQAVRLNNAADDLRLIVDTSEPHNQYIKFFYKIFSHKPMFAKVHESFQYSDELVDNNTQVYYMQETVQELQDKPEGTPISFTFESPRSRENWISISGIASEYKEGQNPDTIAYINGVTSPEIFDPNVLAGRIPFVVHSEEFHKMARRNAVVKTWDSNATYKMGDLVWYNGAFWVANSYMVPKWNKLVDYEKGDFVESGRLLYVALEKIDGSGFNENPSEASDEKWGWLDKVSRVYGTGTVPSDAGTAWSRLPSLFFDSAIDRKSAEEWRPMVLRNTRADVNNYSDDNFYESVWEPAVNPGIEFNAFAIKAEMKSMDSKAKVPRLRKIRVIATL